jgi:glucose-1-phosphatase
MNGTSGRQVILFDLGGVLVESIGRDRLAALLPYPLDRDQIMERWLHSPVVKQFERGRISAEAFARQFIEEWRLPLDPAAFIDSFSKWVTGWFDGAESLVRRLRACHHVACLSNTNAIHWARLAEVAASFDSCFASHLMGSLKPEREAFEHVLAGLRVSAEAVYFFDDLAPNVGAARAVGMNAFQVTGFADIEPILRANGLYAAQRD